MKTLHPALALAALVLLAGCTTPVANRNTVAVDTRLYRIEAGDTAELIAQRHGLTLPDMMAINPDVNWTQLKAGQMIHLEAPEAPLVLPKMVVLGSTIPAGWLEVAWECKGPMPIDHLKRAWITKVLAGSPAEAAGFRVGDELLAISGVPIEQMTGVSLQLELKRDRSPGSQEEFSIRTPGYAKRTVVIVFEAR